MARPPGFVRNLQATAYFDEFLVSAVGAILLLRFYLYVTGFPKVGGKGLHIAHMLWGGLLMLIAVIVLLGYLNRSAKRLAAVLAGIGFGLFVDEIGKFLTSDNNYFFRPAISIIYIAFVLLYLGFATLQRNRVVTPREYLINGLQSLQEAILRGMDHHDYQHARFYISRAGTSDPIAGELLRLMDDFHASVSGRVTRLEGLEVWVHTTYTRLVRKPWFDRAVIALFIGVSFVSLLFASLLVLLALRHLDVTRYVHSFSRVAGLASGAVASAFAVAGAVMMVRDRLEAYRLFRISVLISLLLTQVFVFYVVQFWALIDLALNLVSLVVITTMIGVERVHRPTPEQDAAQTAAAPAVGNRGA